MRSKFKAETEVRLGDKNEKKGLARGKRNRDGSKGGTGRNTHGGLTELTKNSDVVKEARKLLAAPGSPPEVVEAGRIAAAQYYVDYLRMMGEIAETLPDLRKELPPTKAIKDALKDAEWLCAKSLEPETKVVAADIEGTSSADNPLSTVTEFGAGQQSLATGGVEPSRMETICDERGGEAGCSAPLRPRQRFQASLALDEALTSTGGVDGAAARGQRPPRGGRALQAAGQAAAGRLRRARGHLRPPRPLHIWQAARRCRHQRRPADEHGDARVHARPGPANALRH